MYPMAGATGIYMTDAETLGARRRLEGAEGETQQRYVRWFSSSLLGHRVRLLAGGDTPNPSPTSFSGNGTIGSLSAPARGRSSTADDRAVQSAVRSWLRTPEDTGDPDWPPGEPPAS